jgi:hypothetical protein
MIDVEKLKEAIRKVISLYGYEEELYEDICDSIDSIAQPVEPVKAEAIETVMKIAEFGRKLNSDEEFKKSFGEIIRQGEAELEEIRRRG